MATLTFIPYHSFFLTLANKETDFNSDDIRLTAHTASYTPDRAAHDYVNDLSAEVAAGGGYSTGGVTLTGCAQTKVAANAWSQQWATATAYQVGQIRRPTTGNGFLYRAVVAGTSHATTEPTWPTVVGTTVVDQGVTWLCVGTGAIVLTFTGPTPLWAALTITFRHLVVSNRTPATAATQPLIGYFSYGSDQSTGGGDFTATPDAGAGVLVIPIP